MQDNKSSSKGILFDFCGNVLRILLLHKTITCDSFHLAIQAVRRHTGSMGLLYDSDVLSWSKTDFRFSFAVRLMAI